jgi:hypothetical protein
MLNKKKPKSTIQGSTQRYEIVREVIRPPMDCESNVEKGFMLGIVHTIFDVPQFVPLSKMMRSLF